MINDTTTRDMLNHAAIKGAADKMEDTSLAQSAILSTLLDERIALDGYQRHGLLVALKALAGDLGHHADHLQGHVAEAIEQTEGAES